jgi:hypothetical protein
VCSSDLLQQALLDTHQAQGELLGLIARYESRKEIFKRRYDLYAEMVRVGDLAGASEASYLADIKAKRYLVANLNTSASSLSLAGSFIGEIMSATSEYVPRFVGFSMDVLRPASAAIETVGVVTKMVLETTASMLTIASERVAVDQEQIDGLLLEDILGLGRAQAGVSGADAERHEGLAGQFEGEG